MSDTETIRSADGADSCDNLDRILQGASSMWRAVSHHARDRLRLTTDRLPEGRA